MAVNCMGRGMTEIRIDLAKARKAPNYLYFVRLLRAMNDLLSVHQSIKAIDESTTLAPSVKLHLKMYLLSIQHGHLAEACKTFVYKINPNDSHVNPVKTWILGKPKLRQQFTSLRKILDEQFATNLRSYRDNLVFHYDGDKQSKQTEIAFDKQIAYWLKFSRKGPCELNLIVMGDDVTGHRYFIADHLLRMHWDEQLGLKGPRAETKVITTAQRNLFYAFLKFGNAAFYAWCVENDLRING